MRAPVLCSLFVLAVLGAHAAAAQAPAGEAARLLAEGSRAREESHWSDAITALERAVALSRGAHDVASEAKGLKELGGAYLGQGDYRRALDAEREAVRLADQSKDPESRAIAARALAFIGHSLKGLGLVDQARDYFDKSLAAALAIPNRTIELVALSGIATLAEEAGDAQTAAGTLERMLPLARAEGDRKGLTWVLAHLGLARSNLHDWAAAAGHFKEGLALCQAAHDLGGEIVLLHALGGQYLHIGQMGEAKATAARLLALARQTGKPAHLTLALSLLALIELTESDFQGLLATAGEQRQLARRTGDTAREEEAVANGALAAHRLGLPSAMAAYRELLAVARASGNAQDLGLALNTLGLDAALHDDHRQAVEYATELLAHARKRQDLVLQADALCLSGAENRALGRQAQATVELEECLRLSRQAGYALGEAEALRKMGIGLLQQGKPLGTEYLKKGIARGSEALAELERGTAQRQPDEPAASTLALMGRTVRELEAIVPQGGGDEMGSLAAQSSRALLRDDPQAAHAAAAKLYSLARGSGDERFQDIALELLILAALRSGVREEQEQLTTLSQERLALARRRADPRSEAQSLQSLAEGQLLGGDPRSAGRSAEQALALARQTSNAVLERASLNLLTRCALLLGDYAAVIRWSEESLRLARQEGDPERQAQALIDRGAARNLQGDLVGAIADCAAAAALDRPSSVLSALLCVANSYLQVQDTERSQAVATRLRDRAHQMGDPAAEGHGTELLADGEMLRGHLAEAAKLLTESAGLQARAKTETGPWEAERKLGTAAALLGDWRGASVHLERALALLRDRRSPLALAASGPAESLLRADLCAAYIALGDKTQALAAARELLSIARFAPGPGARAVALHAVGHAQFLAGDPAAEDTLRQALAAWEESRAALGAQAQFEKAAVLDSESATDDLLQQVLVAAGKIDAALEVAESSRARGFVELLAGRWGGTVARFSVAAARRLAREKQLTLVEYSLLQDPAALLLPSRANGTQPHLDRELLIWVISPSGTVTLDRVNLAPARRDPEPSLFALVKDLRYAVGGRGRGVHLVGGSSAGQLLARLYEKLVAPIAGRLPSDATARVVFIPQGPLNLVPFAALRTPGGRYLVEDHTVLTAPSIQALMLLPEPSHRPPATGEDALVAGAPEIAAELRLEPYQLDLLRGSEEETREVAGALRTRPLLGADATRDEVVRRLPGRRLVHLATHGVLEKLGDPLLPGAIVLAPGARGNGVLTAREILGLDLHAELVVLSACDTAGGRISSDGVLGLARAFLSAGASALVGTIWSIPDQETAWLMRTFYRQLAMRSDPVAALREAMLAAIQAGREPKSWAGFIVVGGVR
jgi:hypothetical protein